MAENFFNPTVGKIGAHSFGSVEKYNEGDAGGTPLGNLVAAQGARSFADIIEREGKRMSERFVVNSLLDINKRLALLQQEEEKNLKPGGNFAETVGTKGLAIMDEYLSTTTPANAKVIQDHVRSTLQQLYAKNMISQNFIDAGEDRAKLENMKNSATLVMAFNPELFDEQVDLVKAKIASMKHMGSVDKEAEISKYILDNSKAVITKIFNDQGIEAALAFNERHKDDHGRYAVDADTILKLEEEGAAQKKTASNDAKSNILQLLEQNRPLVQKGSSFKAVTGKLSEYVTQITDITDRITALDKVAEVSATDTIASGLMYLPQAATDEFNKILLERTTHTPEQRQVMEKIRSAYEVISQEEEFKNVPIPLSFLYALSHTEATFNPNARNKKVKTVYGLYQINVAAHEGMTDAIASDPLQATRFLFRYLKKIAIATDGNPVLMALHWHSPIGGFNYNEPDSNLANGLTKLNMYSQSRDRPAGYLHAMKVGARSIRYAGGVTELNALHSVSAEANKDLIKNEIDAEISMGKRGASLSLIETISQKDGIDIWVGLTKVRMEKIKRKGVEFTPVVSLSQLEEVKAMNPEAMADFFGSVKQKSPEVFTSLMQQVYGADPELFDEDIKVDEQGNMVLAPNSGKNVNYGGIFYSLGDPKNPYKDLLVHINTNLNNKHLDLMLFLMKNDTIKNFVIAHQNASGSLQSATRALTRVGAAMAELVISTSSGEYLNSDNVFDSKLKQKVMSNILDMLSKTAAVVHEGDSYVVFPPELAARINQRDLKVLGNPKLVLFDANGQPWKPAYALKNDGKGTRVPIGKLMWYTASEEMMIWDGNQYRGVSKPLMIDGKRVRSGSLVAVTETSLGLKYIAYNAQGKPNVIPFDKVPTWLQAANHYYSEKKPTMKFVGKTVVPDHYAPKPASAINAWAAELQGSVNKIKTIKDTGIKQLYRKLLAEYQKEWRKLGSKKGWTEKDGTVKMHVQLFWSSWNRKFADFYRKYKGH